MRILYKDDKWIDSQANRLINKIAKAQRGYTLSLAGMVRRLTDNKAIVELRDDGVIVLNEGQYLINKKDIEKEFLT